MGPNFKPGQPMVPSGKLPGEKWLKLKKVTERERERA